MENKKIEQLDMSSQDNSKKNEELRNKVEDLLKRRNELRKNKDLKIKQEIINRIAKFSEHIRSQYGEIKCQKYPMYRVIAFGSPPDNYLENYIDIDFPDNDSIEKFIEKLEEEYNK